MEITPAGAVFSSEKWPPEINVERNLLDYLPGPHISFSRFGVLSFTAINGYAVYRRFEDIPGGWNYRLVESDLKAQTPAAAASEPAPVKADSWYRKNADGPPLQAFQWLPHAVPPVQLPEWFMRANFEHDDKGELIVRQSGGAWKAAPADWILRSGLEIAVMKPDIFSQAFTMVDAA
jgi:hypothetical protein